MAKRSVTKSATNVATVDETTVATDIVAEENMEVEEEIVEKVEVVAPLKDTDEIEIISLIPNVSYKDSHTDDFYVWEKPGHIEYMTFETLKNMWRNSKGYFRNMWLKPLDNRVIKKFGLESVFEKHDYLLDESNYTKKNIKKICESISSASNGMKFSIFSMIKDWVVDGKITDITVIREIEKHFDLDLISFIN